MINPYQLLYYVILSLPLLIFSVIFLLLLRDDRIHCYIINRNHDVRRKKVNPNKESFKERDSIYMIPSDCVTLSSTEKGLNPQAELFYVEDNPLPINFKPKKYKDDEGKEIEYTPDQMLMDKTWIEKVFKDAGKPSGFAFDVISDYLRDPRKLMMLVFVLIIVGAIMTPRYAPELLEALPR